MLNTLLICRIAYQFNNIKGKLVRIEMILAYSYKNFVVILCFLLSMCPTVGFNCESEINIIDPIQNYYDYSNSKYRYDYSFKNGEINYIEQSSHSDKLSGEIVCSPGSWPLGEHCYIKNNMMWINLNEIKNDSNNLNIYSNLNSVKNILRRSLKEWNIHITNITPICNLILPHVIFIPIPYNKSKYQSNGSNYYVIHTDILIPLWVYIKKLLKLHIPYESIYIILIVLKDNQQGISIL